jgi:hypothetical protein
MPRRHFVKKHTPYEHKAPCSRKRSFKTEAEALVAIENSVITTELKLKVYLCPYCNSWHLSTINS